MRSTFYIAFVEPYTNIFTNSNIIMIMLGGSRANKEEDRLFH